MDVCKDTSTRMFISELFIIVKLEATPKFNILARLSNLQYIPYNGILFSYLTNDVTGAWVMQLVNHRTLDSGPGHDLRVIRSGPTSSSTLGTESA